MLWVSAAQVQAIYIRNSKQVGHVGLKLVFFSFMHSPYILASDSLIPITILAFFINSTQHMEINRWLNGGPDARHFASPEEREEMFSGNNIQ